MLLDFVNTHGHAHAAEQWGDAHGLRTWLHTAGYGDLDVTDADAAAARELRDALVTVLLSHTGGATDEEAAAARRRLDVIAARHPLTVSVTPAGAVLVPAQGGLPGVFGAVLAAVAELSGTGEWQRVKACRNPPCHLAFVDHSRNGSAVYCSRRCGSQASMRAHRARLANR